MTCWRCGTEMGVEVVRYPSGLTLERWACPICGERRPFGDAAAPRFESYRIPTKLPLRTWQAIRKLQATGDVIVVRYPTGYLELVVIP